MQLNQLKEFGNSVMKTGNKSLHLVSDNIPSSVTNTASKAMTTVSHKSSDAISWAKKHPVKAAIFGVVGLGIIGATTFFARKGRGIDANIETPNNLPQ